MALYRSLGARPDDTRGTTALEVRKDFAALFTGPGVLPGGASPLVQGTDGFAYQVNRAGWVTSRGAGDGVHLWGNDGPLNVATDPAPAAGLSRIDVIYALHPSDSENGDGSSEPVVAVAVGTPASSPVAPSIPVGALELARNTMTSSATSTSSDGNTISQSAPAARLRTHSESLQTLTVTLSGSGTRWVASADPQPPAPYDRVCEVYAHVNASGLAGESQWELVLVRDGSSITQNVVARARFPFSPGIAVAGSATICEAFDVPAGASFRPSIGVERLASSGTLNLSNGTVRFRVRPKF